MAALAAVVIAGCSRTPAELAPASSVDSPAVTSAAATSRSAPLPSATTPLASASTSAKPDAGARCLGTFAAEPPPIPAVASVAACPKDPDGIPKSQSANLTFPDAPSVPKVDVEIAQSESEVTRGLMYRRSMPEEHGMLFLLGERREHTFWMHNTCMPLDMLFVDEDGTIVGIVESATPLTDSSRTAGCPSLYVLEVNAGWCRRHGVKPGQKLAGIPASAH